MVIDCRERRRLGGKADGTLALPEVHGEIKVAKKTANKTVESIRHEEDKRKNIPTAEFQSVLEKEQQAPKTIRYPRNTDLDLQLVWRGKDEQDWSDLVVHAPALYIQEKVHPKVLIDDLLAQTKSACSTDAPQLDLFSDFNGIPAGSQGVTV